MRRPSFYDMIGIGRKVPTGRLLLGSTKAEGVMAMSDFELLTVMFTVIGLLLTAFALGTKKK